MDIQESINKNTYEMWYFLKSYLVDRWLFYSGYESYKDAKLAQKEYISRYGGETALVRITRTVVK